MKLKSTCVSCNKNKWFAFARKRVYYLPRIGKDKSITSQGKLCRKCYNGIKRIVISQ